MPHPFPTVRPDAYREARDRIRRAALAARERDREAARTIRAAYRGAPALAALHVWHDQHERSTVAAELLDAAR